LCTNLHIYLFQLDTNLQIRIDVIVTIEDGYTVIFMFGKEKFSISSNKLFYLFILISVHVSEYLSRNQVVYN